MKKVLYSFEQWCLDNNRTDLLVRWDYALNEHLPSEISYKSNKKFWFLCPKNIHESQLQNIQYFAAGKQKEMKCTKCGSFAQYIVDNYNNEYLLKLEKMNPAYNLWTLSYQSTKKLTIECYQNKEHIYTQSCEGFVKTGCPYCAHRNGKISKEQSLGYLFPETLKIWSTRNKLTAYEVFPNSTCLIWWSCPDSKHEEYLRSVAASHTCFFRCPECSIEKIAQQPTGEKAYAWKGGKTPENKLIRTSDKYKQWRDKCYTKDKHTCQCCGKRGAALNAHHIRSFASHPDLRFVLSNGITLCEECHAIGYPDSFHTLYGTIDNTPEQLEEYINHRRKSLGINIPFNIKEYQINT